MQIFLALRFVALGVLLLNVLGCETSTKETAAVVAPIQNVPADSLPSTTARAASIVVRIFPFTSESATIETSAYLSVTALPTAPQTVTGQSFTFFFQALAASVLPSTRGWPSFTFPAFPKFSGLPDLPSIPANFLLPDIPAYLGNITLPELPVNITLPNIPGILGNFTMADLLPLLPNITFPILPTLRDNITMADLTAILEKLPMSDPATPISPAATELPTYSPTLVISNLSTSTPAITDSGLFGNFFCFTPQNRMMSGLGCW
jgi:hypothetical protein